MPVPVLEDSQRIYRSGLKALGGERLGNVRAPIESDMRVIMNKWRLLEDPQRIYPDVNGDFVFFNELQEVLVMLHNMMLQEPVRVEPDRAIEDRVHSSWKVFVKRQDNADDASADMHLCELLNC